MLALAWAAWRIVAVGYQELTVPSDVAMPVAWRIALGAPDAFVLVGLTWLIGEAVGAIAARRIVLAGERGRDALRQAVHRSRRMPRRLLAFAAASTLVAVAVIALTAIAAGTAWDALRAAFARGDTSPGTIALLVVFVALFCGGLVLLALTAAWRTAIWTLDVGRSRPGRSGEGAAPGRGTGTVQGGLAT
jgi:hypothetical protein